jgi:hypothetical protein
MNSDGNNMTVAQVSHYQLQTVKEKVRMWDLQEVGCVCVDWIELAQNRDRGRALVNAVMNLRVQ